MEKMNKIAVIGLSGESIFMKCDHFHEEGETVVAYAYHKEYGGKGFNQAIAAKRMNAMVSFLTVMGEDSIKDAAKEVLDKEGINSYIITKAKGSSAAANILIDKDGNNEVSCYLGVSNQFTKEDVDLFEDEIATSKYLLLQLETSDEALEEAIKLASIHNTKIILNPAPAHPLPYELLSLCEWITPNEQEAKILYPSFDLSKKDSYLALPKNVIVTLGKEGVLYFDEEKKEHVILSTRKVKAVNTTGAGDTFNGSFAALLLSGKNKVEAIKLASLSATLSVTKEFVIDSIPSLFEVSDFYKESKNEHSS